MAWRNCKASVVLGLEVNARWPNRDRASDGTIGDASHATRESDHNPWLIDDGIGVVRARDIDEDLDGNTADSGKDAWVLFAHLLRLAKAGDPRLNGGGYLIYERMIYSERNGWAPRNYVGPNAHAHHIHVSFSRNKSGYDSVAPWGIANIGTTKPPPPKPTGVFDMLTDAEQEEVLAKLRANDLRLQQIQKILLGDAPEKGDTQQRQIGALSRLERDVDILLERE